MSRTKVIFISLAVLLVGGIYWYLYRDWLSPADIQIVHTVRAGEPPGGRRQRGPSQPGPTVVFGFSQKVRLTSVKIIPVAELESNKYAHAMWYLVSDSNSVPVKAFSYGDRIRGMKPKVAGVPAEPLATNVTYRLLVETTVAPIAYDFTIGNSATRTN